MFRPIQRTGHAPDGVPQKVDFRNSSQQLALPKDQRSVQMADNGSLDPVQLRRYESIFREVGQRRGIVTEKEHPILAFQTSE